MNRVGQFVRVIGDQRHYGGQRRLITVRLSPIDGRIARSVEDQLMDRIAALTMYAANTMTAMQRLNDDYSLSVVMDAGLSGFVMLQYRWFVSSGFRRFETVDDIEELLPEAIIQAMENMQQSERDIPDIEEFIFELRYDLPYVARARGKMPKNIMRAIQNDNVGGLYKYEHCENACGFKAVVYAITANSTMRNHWTGPLGWYMQQFNANINVDMLKRNKNRFNALACDLANQIGVVDPQQRWDIMLGGSASTSKLFIQHQPKMQVVIYNQVTRQLMEHERGTQFSPALAKNTSFLMSYTCGHLQLIKSPYEYFGLRQGNKVFCYVCLKFCAPQHQCDQDLVQQCDRCLMVFGDADSMNKHTKVNERDSETCDACEKDFYSEACRRFHRCSARNITTCRVCGNNYLIGIEHHCGKYKCVVCKVYVERDHKCQLVKPDPPEDTCTPESEGEHYYAFDVESMLTPQDDGSRLHTVNLVVVRRCFQENEEWVFGDAREFIKWLEKLKKPSTFYAHNMKGYDGRLIFEQLLDDHTPPVQMTWAGAKIMEMRYGKHKFRDTLTHLTASLAQLPKMLGLDEREFKKGFFPYLFNMEENQDYVGPIPGKDAFDPECMSPAKREEFDRWYDEQLGIEYNFHRELVEYCQSDVKILTKAIETYMRAAMTKHPMNPLRSITCAGYAKSVYMTYYLPEDTLYRLSINAYENIRKAMHGGRTDTRRLLREWTDDEVAAGYYGCYQDVQSLYPTVQFYDPMPVGQPVYQRYGGDMARPPTKEHLKTIFGFVCCDIEPKTYLHHPILVEVNDEGRLVGDLLPKRRIVLPTPELHLALDHGYEVTAVYWSYHFEKSTDLFKGYMRQFLKDKLEASGVPGWVRTEEDWEEFANYHQEKLGIELVRDKMVKNASRKTGAKLLCNSLWGKFGERMHPNFYECFRTHENDDMIMGLERQWVDGDIDISYRRFNRDNSHVAMVYKYSTEDKVPSFRLKEHLGRTHIAIAAMVTSHARCRLWAELNKLGDRVLYHDTDSIIYEHSPDGYNIPLGRYLGEWEDETGGDPITKFASTGPKCYSYIVQRADGTQKSATKVKGITLNSENARLIDYQAMKDIVTKTVDQIAARSLLFNYDRNRGTFITKTTAKVFKMTYNKGEVDESDWKVYPFGHHRYLLPEEGQSLSHQTYLQLQFRREAEAAAH